MGGGAPNTDKIKSILHYFPTVTAARQNWTTATALRRMQLAPRQAAFLSIESAPPQADCCGICSSAGFAPEATCSRSGPVPPAIFAGHFRDREVREMAIAAAATPLP